MKYYKAKLTTHKTKKGHKGDILIFEAKNPMEAAEFVITHCKNRGETNGSPWFLEDLIEF